MGMRSSAVRTLLWKIKVLWHNFKLLKTIIFRIRSSWRRRERNVSWTTVLIWSENNIFKLMQSVFWRIHPLTDWSVNLRGGSLAKLFCKEQKKDVPTSQRWGQSRFSHAGKTSGHDQTHWRKLPSRNRGIYRDYNLFILLCSFPLSWLKRLLYGRTCFKYLKLYL